MKITVLLFMMLLLAGCVQKAVNRTVIYELTVPQQVPGAISIRGGDKPLSWRADRPMKLVAPGVYRDTVTYKTGLLFTEVKFLRDAHYEWEEGPNRRIDFGRRDTFFYRAVFAEEKKENTN